MTVKHCMYFSKTRSEKNFEFGENAKISINNVTVNNVTVNLLIFETKKDSHFPRYGLEIAYSFIGICSFTYIMVLWKFKYFLRCFGKKKFWMITLPSYRNKKWKSGIEVWQVPLTCMFCLEPTGSISKLYSWRRQFPVILSFDRNRQHMTLFLRHLRPERNDVPIYENFGKFLRSGCVTLVNKAVYKVWWRYLTWAIKIYAKGGRLPSPIGAWVNPAVAGVFCTRILRGKGLRMGH